MVEAGRSPRAGSFDRFARAAARWERRPGRSSRGSHVDRTQSGLDERAVWLEERWQRESLAQMLRVLVGGEAGPVGRDLVQDPTGLAEIDRLEVIALDHRRRPQATPGDPLLPGLVLLRVRRAERDVVNPANPGVT